MTLAWFDSHCHFDFDVFTHRQEQWQLAQQYGVCGLIIPGITRLQGELLAQFCAQQPWFYALGLHPYFMNKHALTDIDWLEKKLQTDTNILAVGEIGLDNVIATTESELAQQWQYFDAQIQLAKRYNKRVILHVRGMHDEIAAYLRKQQFSGGGIVHAFSGSEQQGKAWLNLGFSLGIGGAMTHARANKLRKTIHALPLNAWLLETDSPDMKPAFWSGPMNSPVAIPLLAACLAAIKQISIAELASIQQAKLVELWPAVSGVFQAK